MSKITEEVETIITPILDELNFELVEVEYTKEGKDHFLRISIDKEGGVNLNDCTLASEKSARQWMRMIQFQIYYLDVASPGAERPIKKDYHNAIDKPVFVSLYAPIEGDKKWLGILKVVDDDTITMEVKEKAKTKQIEIPRNKIAKARHSNDLT